MSPWKSPASRAPSQSRPQSRAQSHTRDGSAPPVTVAPPADETALPSPTPAPTPTTSMGPDPEAAAAAPSRRSHAKSRTGCRTCKRRKIKCDEHRPSCRNCIKHAVACDFIQGQAPSAAAVPNGQQPFTPSAAHGDQLESLGGPGGINMVDLELIHNFTTFTHATLSSDPSLRQMFKTAAIRMALDCEFLMRTILALSAVHLAHSRRERHDFYVRVAMHHHQVACRLAVSVMDHLDNLSKEDCENLHLFSVLTMFFALGSPKTDQSSLVMGDSMIPSWLTMLRSAEPILSVLNPSTYRGPLAPLFAFGRGRWRVVYGGGPRPHGSLMLDLQSFINKSCAEPGLLPIYNEVIDQLRRVLSMLVVPRPAADGGHDVDGDTTMSPAVGPSLSPRLDAWDVFVWQWDSAKDFIPLLRGPEIRQEAAVIYAHFLIMLKKLESQWWLEGWARHLMECVWLSLDQEHRPWIQWPIEELGWVPP